MNFPFIFMGVVAFALIFALIRVKNDYKTKNDLENFWNLEEKANSVRRKNLDSLPYIIIPVSKLPFSNSSEPDTSVFENEIIDLSKRKIVNLTGRTNTELKLEYGAPNLPELISYDENFTRLAKALVSWGETLYDKGKTDDALTVLEFGVKCGTDIAKNYTLLAQLYKYTDNPSKISWLIESAENISGSRKNAIIESLNNIK